MATPGAELVKVLERTLGLLERRTTDVAGTGYVSSQQPFGDIAQRLWHIRRRRYAGLHHLSLLFAPSGPIETLAARNGWPDDFRALQVEFRAAFDALNGIRYFQTEQRVELGDHVEVRGLLRTRRGRVSYLPGQPRHDPDIDFGGLFRVGIHVPGHSFAIVHVDPDSLDLRKYVRFVSRDPRDVPEMPLGSTLDQP
jgi:hypothetical protein